MRALRERWDERKKLGCVRRAEGQGGVLSGGGGGGWWLVFLVMSSDGFLLHAAGHAGTCWTTSIAVDAYLQALQ